ncbi:uncharacterized protein LOC131160742 [Malania oleifera]|uniref:uncharacterized protein LOC131160742 n=1 Tax=Malania oleifera TaxID=397392 RepID=UPI0025AE2FA9|nr:uncharacterized protein LOC131160742 [Malania oleifera]
MALNSFLRSWKVNVVFTQHDKGWIVLQFQREEDLNEVLQNGPYSIYGRTLILNKMPKFFQFGLEHRTVVPVWVQLKDLPFELWSPEAIDGICSAIGRPLRMDKLTTTKGRISYARSMVEIDIAKEIKHRVKILLLEEVEISQEIVYESLPWFCQKCKSIGHTEAFCSPRGGVKKPKVAQYRPKMNARLPNTEEVADASGIVGLENEKVATSSPMRVVEEGKNADDGKMILVPEVPSEEFENDSKDSSKFATVDAAEENNDTCLGPPVPNKDKFIVGDRIEEKIDNENVLNPPGQQQNQYANGKGKGKVDDFQLVKRKKKGKGPHYNLLAFGKGLSAPSKAR